MASRIYHVEMYPNDSGSIEHLVDAPSQAAAARHVLQTYGKVTLASQRVLAHLCQRGCKIEVAGAEAE